VPGARLAEDQDRPARREQRLERVLGLADRRAGAERASEMRRGSRVAALLSARVIVPSSFARPIGFSRKSNAPMRVASTAVSIVPWPDIMTTGIVSWPELPHSRSSVTPSVSGIQMSSSTSAGCMRERYARASCAFSATATR
jgi:hypothetical protein